MHFIIQCNAKMKKKKDSCNPLDWEGHEGSCTRFYKQFLLNDSAIWLHDQDDSELHILRFIIPKYNAVLQPDYNLAKRSKY